MHLVSRRSCIQHRGALIQVGDRLADHAVLGGGRTGGAGREIRGGCAGGVRAPEVEDLIDDLADEIGGR